MKLKCLILALLLFVQGCRSKTRLIQGDLEANVPSGLCSGLMNQNEYSSLLGELYRYVELAKTTDNLDNLSAFAQEVSRVIQELKSVVKEPNSREVYIGQYQWKFLKKHRHLRSDLKITPVALSVNTVEFPIDQLLVENTSDAVLFTWKKPMSALEYCLSSESAFSVIKLEYSDREEFLRLEVPQKKENL
jgi:hypothetical protein